MNHKSYRDGKIVDSEIAMDRSLLYGDGVFTTISVEQGQPLFLTQHLQRLAADCHRIKLVNISIESIQSSLMTAIQDVNKAIVRITISRSSGTRGYLCQHPQPVYWITVSEWPDHIEKFRLQGIQIRLCEQRLSQNSSLAGIKHCNRLEQVLARNEWSNEDIQEGIMLDTSDWVIEGTMSNIFIIKEQQLTTPDLTFAGVEGIMRALIIDIAETQQIPVTTDRISITQLMEADAVFVCNSVIGIWPVTALGEHFFKQHPLTNKLQDELIKRTRYETNTV